MSAKSAASQASASASSASSIAASSASSISKAASLSASSLSKGASNTLSAAGATASARVTDAYQQTSTTSIVLMTIMITTTAIAGILAAIYYSGYADDILEAMAKKYYSAKAKTEAAAFQHAGSEKAQSFLKDQLKKNPMMGEGELDQVSSGLGGEAKGEGLAGVSSKLGGLGKF